MASLPSISARAAVAAFEKLGFKFDRKTSSHYIMKKPGFSCALSVPVHGNRPVKNGTLRSLIRDAEISIEEFVALLD